MLHHTNRMRTRWVTWLSALGLGALVSLAGMAMANDELMALQEQEGTWAMPNATYEGWNYSELDRINRFNVQDLEVAWTFQTGVTDSHEGQPLVIGNTMYLVTPKPNVLYSLDLTRDGVINWSFAPDQPNLEQAISAACCGGQTRGVSYAGGNLYFNTLDGQLFGVDAEDGEVLWSQQVADLDIAETSTTAPLIVHDQLIIGVAGGERGVRGWVAAYDLETGEENWKYYNMGPNDEMGVGPRFDPFYEIDQLESPGTETWYEDSWQTGGGTVWGWWSYDPDHDLFYYSTGNCGPWNPDYRRDPATAPGFDEYPNKYCASLMARDATSGELIWAYSLTPQDQWDLDEPGVNHLIDMEIDGEMRETLVKPARNGWFYVFDRVTGELLREPFKFTEATNWANDISAETGEVDFNMDKVMYTDVTVENVCPFIAARNWENDAYSPRTGLVYFTAQNECADMTMVEGEYTPGESYTLVEFGETYPGPGGHTSELVAYDPATGEKAFGITQENFGNENPILATAGDVLFQGTDEGTLRAMDARTGEQLWNFRAGAEFNNSPMTFIGPDGKQYLAVIASSSPGDNDVAADAPADDSDRYARPGSTMYVFTLP